MPPSETDTDIRIQQALALLQEALTPYVAASMQDTFGETWAQEARQGLRDPYLQQKTWDVDALLLIMANNWASVFQDRLGQVGHSLIGEMRLRTHAPASTDLDDTYRTLDTIARLLRLLGAEASADRVRQDARAVMQVQFQQPSPAMAPPTEETPSVESTEAPEPKKTTDAPPAEAAHDTPAEDPPAPEEARAPEEEKGKEEDAWGDEPEDGADADDRNDAEAGPSLLERASIWFRGIQPQRQEHDLTPLELRKRLLDNVEDALWDHRSKKPLPFVELKIHILATDPRLYHRYEDALEQLEPPVHRAVPDSLRDAGFEPLPDLSVSYALYETAPDDLAAAFETYGSVYVTYAKRQYKRSSSATLSVRAGKAGADSYRLTSDRRFNVGRLKEVREGSYGHLVRQNDVAFLGEDDSLDLDPETRAINNTVSRKHARIEYDERAGQFFLYKVEGDTVISRRGYDTPVQVLYQPIALEDGDLIYLGRACLRFETNES